MRQRVAKLLENIDQDWAHTLLVDLLHDPASTVRIAAKKSIDRFDNVRIQKRIEERQIRLWGTLQPAAFVLIRVEKLAKEMRALAVYVPSVVRNEMVIEEGDAFLYTPTRQRTHFSRLWGGGYDTTYEFIPDTGIVGTRHPWELVTGISEAERAGQNAVILNLAADTNIANEELPAFLLPDERYTVRRYAMKAVLFISTWGETADFQANHVGHYHYKRAKDSWGNERVLPRPTAPESVRRESQTPLTRGVLPLTIYGDTDDLLGVFCIHVCDNGVASGEVWVAMKEGAGTAAEKGLQPGEILRRRAAFVNKRRTGYDMWRENIGFIIESVPLLEGDHLER